MKKILSIILTLAMLVSSMPNILVFASNESTALETGDTVVLYAFLSDNPGVSELVLSFEYDSSAMNLVKVTNGEAMSDATYTGPKNLASGCMATWYYIDEPDYFKDGSLVALEFEIVDSKAMGNTYPLSVVIVSAEGINGTVFDLQNNIRVIDYRPGDVNGDGVHSLRYDVSEFNQYIVDGCKYDPLGYAVQINENAADVNNDGVITIKDVIDVNKYIVDGGVYDPNGYAVKLYPHTEICKHTSLTAVDATEATCTEDGNIAYWECDDCGKYFEDEGAANEIAFEDTAIEAKHKLTKIPEKAPTETEKGNLEHWLCSVCSKLFLDKDGINETTVAEVEIPILLPNQYSITYFIDSGDYIDYGDAYLKAQTITNPNPIIYEEGEQVLLQKLSTPGYTFDGWVDQTGTRWDLIPAGTNKNLVLYAKWTQNVYTVNFDSPDVPVEITWYDATKGVNVTSTNSAKYRIDQGLPFVNPKVHKYEFLGWSNNDGFIVDGIKAGTTGDMWVHANWTSARNFATSYADYGDPIIIEDNDRKQFLFVYNIGRIDNVPLYEYKDENGDRIGVNGGTLNITETTEVSVTFGTEDAKAVANKVANATTRSSGWTLSEEWSDTFAASETDEQKNIKSSERTNTEGKDVGGKYFISNSEGGSSYSSVESGSSSSSSAKITTENSFGINTSYDKSTEKYCDSELKTGFKNETELSAGISAPVGIAKVEAGVKNTTTITADAKLSSGRKDNESFHVDTNSSSYVGTDFSSSSSSHYNAVTSNSTNWNSEKGYETSEMMSSEQSVSAAIAEEIAKTTQYNITESLSKAYDNTQSVSGMTSNETGYSNSITVSEFITDKKVKTETHTDNNYGYHRLVEAGTVHVYGVVGYDIATASYYTYTFNVLEDDTFKYWDYSLKRATFDDCENGLVTFEIPYEVNEYIAGVTGQTEGLEIEIDNDGYGSVKAFDVPENFSGDVVVPQYLGADNLDDTFDPVVVTSFSANAFRGKKDIKTVILPMYVTEIPDYAFEGCTNLETVIAYGVTKIGDYAFKGCESLGKIVNKKGETEFSAFMIDNLVTELGEGAFDGVNEIKIMAYDSDVADAAINSGANRITLDLTKLADDYSGIKSITASTEYFGIIGGEKTFSGLKIKSNADETFISNIKLTDNIDIPLELSSETVSLLRVTVENAPGIALHLSAENTALKLFQTVTLTSKSNNSVLSKNVSLSKANSGITGTLDFSGNYLVYGEIINTSMLKYPENAKVITKEEYNKYLGSVTVSFDTDEGSDVADVETAYDTIIDSPTDPTKDHYSFLGWYTDEGCTTEFDFSTPITSDITLYAKWKLNEFNVTFNANDGNVTQTAKEVIYGEAYGTLPTPTRTGYTFNGWYTAASGGTKVTADTTVTATTDHTLYAQWTLNTYKVSWSVPTGVSISVKRTSSPLAGAPTDSLSTGNAVNYGDVLTITYTANTGYTLATNGKTSITVTGNVTESDIYATATVNSYKATWSVPTGGTITVKRTSSPLAGATTGTLSSGNTVYHGDVLGITYSANTGYSVATKGNTSVTVAGNVTSNDIYLSVTPNEYTYNVVFESTNGTHLGSTTISGTFNTTSSVSPISFEGYDSPDPQIVEWDSTSAKTITFEYTPSAVAFTKASGRHNTSPNVDFEVEIQYQNRTANSVQIRVVWTSIMQANWNGFNHGFRFSTKTNNVSPSSHTWILKQGAWNANSSSQRRSTGTSDWVTVPVSADTSSVSTYVYVYQANYYGNELTNYDHYSNTWTVNIPKY